LTRGLRHSPRANFERTEAVDSSEFSAAPFPLRDHAARDDEPMSCGFFNDPTPECKCSSVQIQRYISKISGPLPDRIDIHIVVPAVKFKELASETPAESSAAIRERVVAARQIQLERFRPERLFCNAQMTPRLIRKYCVVDSASKALLENAITRLGLSARAYDRILKVSRTLADMEGKEAVDSGHVSEAIQYRTLDRNFWA
jgi:magnesium chelatase family protein